MKKLHTILIATLSVLAVPAIACDMPSSDGREDLYGHTTERSGIDGMNPQFRDSVAAMMDTAAAELGGSMHIYSGYRSVEHQQRLWDEGAARYPDPEVRDNWIARPGSSNHNYGLAADMRWNGARIEYGSPISNWMTSNLDRFGLTRPMSNEGWHIEPHDARSQREGYMAGAPLECNESYDENMRDIPKIILMPWT
jgi:hypothetical protein